MTNKMIDNLKKLNSYGNELDETKDLIEKIKVYDSASSEIKNIMNKLRSCDNKEQQKGIKLAKKVKDLTPFFQPLEEGIGKIIWEECAIIISERSDKELEKYLDKMLEWLKDLTWPGTFKIISRLKTFDYNLLLPQLNMSIEKAINLGDYIWLKNMLELIIDNDQKKCIEKIIRETKNQYEDNRKKWINTNKKNFIRDLESEDELVKVYAMDLLYQLEDPEVDKIISKFKDDDNYLFRVYAEKAECRLNNK